MTAVEVVPVEVETLPLALPRTIGQIAADIMRRRGKCAGAYIETNGSVCSIGAIGLALGWVPSDECQTPFVWAMWRGKQMLDRMDALLGQLAFAVHGEQLADPALRVAMWSDTVPMDRVVSELEKLDDGRFGP